MLPDLVKSISAYVNKLNLFKAHIQKGDLTHFPTLLKASWQVTSETLNSQRDRNATLVEDLEGNFVYWFCNLQLKRPQIMFLVDPFNAEMDRLKAPVVTDEAAAKLDHSVLEKGANGKIPQYQTGCTYDAASVWVNIHL